MLRLLRPKQWTKNLLLFAALIFAEKLFDPGAIVLAVLGFAAFCIASSSVYIVNDLIDVERDRLHPEKRNRPIAAGDVTPAVAWIIAGFLTAAALGLAFWIEIRFGMAVVAYVALTHFYSVTGKHIVILDVMLVAAGFVIRAVAGALSIDVPIGDWFTLCTLFLAVFLALSKRKAEMLALNEHATQTRPVIAEYTASALSAFTATSMAGVLISYALYVLESRAEFQLLALTVPFVMFGIFRYHLLVETSNLGEKAEEVLLSDRPLQLCILGFGALAVLALYGGS